METLNEKFFNVTGLTWDLKQYIESLKTNGMTDEQISEKILWFIPDGAMIELEGRRQSLTEELLSDETLVELGIKESDKIGSDEPEPTDNKYLTFTAGEGGASVGFAIVNTFDYPIPETYMKPSLQYSTDGGKTWQNYDLQISNDSSAATVIELAEGASVMFKGVNENLCNVDTMLSVQAYIEGSVAASGDVTSLLNGVGGDVAVPQYCYYYMFQDCTGLTTAPSLPATTLADSCYFNMFRGCTGLTEAPELPATELAKNCYMFLFTGCTGLTEAPELPATTLDKDCYTEMFSRCTSIASHNVATINDSTDVFYDNSSCVSLTIHADTPPTIVNNTITGLKADCIIYVPAASVDAYKAAEYWSERADYIQAIQ